MDNISQGSQKELKESFNEFWEGDREVMIKGDPTLAKKMATPEALLKETTIEVVTLVWSLKN